MENFDINVNIKNLKSFIYQENQNDFNEKKQKFENILNCKIRNDIFELLYFNSKICPSFNIVSREKSTFIQDLFVQSKGKLPIACKWLYQSNSNITNSLNDKNYLNISNELNEKGYFIKKNFLTSNEIAQIKKELQDFEYFSVKDIFKVFKLNEIKTENLNSSVFASNLTSKLIKKDSILNKLLTSKFIENVSRYYYECNPYLVGAVAFHTKPKNIETFDNSERHMSAQFYHYDGSHLKFLKFFIYLNDINDVNDGAHSFVEGSHESNLKLPLDKKDFEEAGLRRLNNGFYTGNVKDNWISKNYSKKQILNFCYPAGTLIIENTSGFHKANNCITKSRDMLCLSTSLSALTPNNYTRIPIIEVNENYDRTTKEYLSIVDSKERKKKEKVFNLFNKVSFFKKIKNNFHKILSKFS